MCPRQTQDTSGFWQIKDVSDDETYEGRHKLGNNCCMMCKCKSGKAVSLTLLQRQLTSCHHLTHRTQAVDKRLFQSEFYS